jgi:protein phosphatase 4 regulatory subunit 3
MGLNVYEQSFFPILLLLQKEDAIQIFYEKHFHKLIDVIALSCRPKGVTQSMSGSVGVATMGIEQEHPAKPEILLNICEILCFCVRQHRYRIK